MKTRFPFEKDPPTSYRLPHLFNSVKFLSPAYMTSRLSSMFIGGYKMTLKKVLYLLLWHILKKK